MRLAAVIGTASLLFVGAVVLFYTFATSRGLLDDGHGFMASRFATLAATKRKGPFLTRINSGGHVSRNVESDKTWFMDYGYTGGVAANASLRGFYSPPFDTLRLFPLSHGPENCCIVHHVPEGRYSIRIFFGQAKSDESEPLFDTSIEGTVVHSLTSGWISQDTLAFVEAQVSVNEGSCQICFHNTGHGDPTVLALEVFQIDDKAYEFNELSGKVLKTLSRLSFGGIRPKYPGDMDEEPWSGERYWSPITASEESAYIEIYTENNISKGFEPPNFYPPGLYKRAIMSSERATDLEYRVDADANKSYSIWLHFSEIDPDITGVGQRIFDVVINGDIIFQNLDIVHLTGSTYRALVLNTTIAINEKSLTVTLRPKKGFAIINAIEVFEIIAPEPRTLPDEVEALHLLKTTLGVPPQLGWNGDPCAPRQHPWTGPLCQYDEYRTKWVIYGLTVHNKGLKGFLQDDISKLHHLESINLCHNNIHGAIPSSLGAIPSLKVLDLSYNSFNGSIPANLGELTTLGVMYLNNNNLSGLLPPALRGRLSSITFNFSDNEGLYGVPETHRSHHTIGAIVAVVVFGVIGTIAAVVFCIRHDRRQTLDMIELTSTLTRAG